MTLLAFAAERGQQAYQLSIDVCCRRPRSAANPPHADAAVNRRTDGRTGEQTDERTDTRPLHTPCSEYYAGSVYMTVDRIT